MLVRSYRIRQDLTSGSRRRRQRSWTILDAPLMSVVGVEWSSAIATARRRHCGSPGNLARSSSSSVHVSPRGRSALSPRTKPPGNEARDISGCRRAPGSAGGASRAHRGSPSSSRARSSRRAPRARCWTRPSTRTTPSIFADAAGSEQRDGSRPRRGRSQPASTAPWPCAGAVVAEHDVGEGAADVDAGVVRPAGFSRRQHLAGIEDPVRSKPP